jgi:hypothetical protein
VGAHKRHDIESRLNALLSLLERYCQGTILGVEPQFVKRHQPSV